MILSDPAKSGLQSAAWIDGYDYQIKDKKERYHYEKRVCYFSMQCIIATRPNSALDLRRRCTFSMGEQSLCKV